MTVVAAIPSKGSGRQPVTTETRCQVSTHPLEIIGSVHMAAIRVAKWITGHMTTHPVAQGEAELTTIIMRFPTGTCGMIADIVELIRKSFASPDLKQMTFDFSKSYLPPELADLARKNGLTAAPIFWPEHATVQIVREEGRIVATLSQDGVEKELYRANLLGAS